MSTPPSLTFITPTPKITPYIRENLQTRPHGTPWLIVWTNPQMPCQENLGSSVRVVTYPKKYLPIRNFALLRNWALTQVKSEWVFFLDSDEVMNQTAWDKLSHQLKHTNQGVGGYMIKREDVFWNKTLKHGEVGHVWLTRLGRRKFMRYERVVHEVANINGMIKKSQIVVKHHSHQDVSSFLQKISYYAELEASTRNTKNIKLWTELLCFPPAKLLNNFIIKLGLLDGVRGLVYASMMSLHSLLVRIYQLEK